MTLRLSVFTTIAALLLSGCEAADDSDLTVLFADDGKEDQAPLLSDSVALATDMGLVTFDTGALVRPGIAERWVISDDGMNYIFRIGDYRWPDGQVVTAQDVVKMLRLRLQKVRNDSLDAELNAIEHVIARTDEIIEIQLSSPRPRMLDLLAGPLLTLSRDGIGLGPMKVVESAPDKAKLYWPENSTDDDDNARDVFLSAVPAADAIALYQAGRNNIVLGLDYDSMPLITAAEISKDAVVKDPAMGHFGLDIVRDEGVLQRPLLREAIAMAIDRPRLLSAFGVADWNEMTTLSPPQMTNRIEIEPPLWMALGIEERKSRARQRISEAGFRGTELTIFIAGEGPGSDLLFGLLRQEMADIGLQLDRAATRKDADLLLVDQVAHFDDPLWYLTRLSCDQQVICDEASDAMVEQARTLRSLPDRILLLAQAEARLTATYNYIPLAEPLRIFLSRRPIDGLEGNFRALHPLQYFATRPNR